MHVRRVVRDERGFTMVELLVVMMSLGVIVAGAMSLMQIVVRQGNGVATRTDAMQRGRLVLDDVTRQLRSQVCLNEGTGSLVAGSQDSVTFYADLSDGTGVPARRTLTYEPTTRRIRETVYQGTRQTTFGPVSFPTQPTRDRILLSGVVRDGSAPFFTYYRFGSTNPPRPSVLLAVPLSAGNLGLAARIQVRFAVQPHGGGTDPRAATSVQDDVFLRTSNPNATSPNPTCR
jgi:prepilin-type N-terminal cleavage/methylation domain-containing protein